LLQIWLEDNFICIPTGEGGGEIDPRVSISSAHCTMTRWVRQWLFLTNWLHFLHPWRSLPLTSPYVFITY